MIHRISEKPNSRRTTRDDADREYEYTLTIWADWNDNDATIRLHPSLPRIGSPYIHGGVVDAGAPCRHITTNKLQGNVWEATFQFTSKLEEGGGGKSKERPSDPLKWPTEITWSGREIEQYFTTDASGSSSGLITGKILANSAGEPFENPPAHVLVHELLRITRWQTSYNPSAMRSFHGKVNSTLWFGCEAKSAKCLPTEANLTYVEVVNRYLWKVTYQFEIAPELWIPTILMDIGWNQRTTAGELEPILDKNADPVTQPQRLDGSGQPLADTRVAQGGWFGLRFTMYRTIDFNQLQLP